MITTTKDLKMTRGDTLSFAVEFDGLNQDLSSIYFSCKENPNSTEYLFQKKLDDGISKVETDKYRVRVAPEDTKDIEIGTYYYDLQIGINGDIFTLLKGKFTIEYDVTKEG